MLEHRTEEERARTSSTSLRLAPLRGLLLTILCMGAALGCGVESDVALHEGGEAIHASDYEVWARALPREEATGFAIVDQDLVVGGATALRAYYEREVSPLRKRALTVARVGNADDVWPLRDGRALSFCVSDAFGAEKAAVVAALRAASASWEAAADVQFHYEGQEDRRCTARNAAVVFDVRPTKTRVYLARSFFPHMDRSYRSILVSTSAFTVAPPLTLAGILRHELGHTLGLRHEHTRPEAGACYEDDHWRPLTPYDRASVMHYPQCNGTGDWAGTLTAYDKTGIASLYGPPRLR